MNIIRMAKKEAGKTWKAEFINNINISNFDVDIYTGIVRDDLKYRQYRECYIVGNGSDDFIEKFGIEISEIRRNYGKKIYDIKPGSVGIQHHDFSAISW